jgi:hypothetical protein
VRSWDTADKAFDLDGSAVEPDSAVRLRCARFTVQLGEETHSPIQYQSFRAGGVQAEFVVPDGADLAEAHAEALRQLRELSDRQFREQLDAFLAHVREAAEAARGRQR